jgi:hypothetical protein
MHMKLVKIALVAAALQLTVPAVSAQEASTDVATMFATAQGKGQSITDFVAEMTDIKTCSPVLAEQVIEFALDFAKNDPALVEDILKATVTSCVDNDTVTAYAVASGIDPTLVANALNTATAAGGAPGAGAPGAGAATAAIAPAPAPAGNGIGGGTGAGVPEAASGN